MNAHATMPPESFRVTALGRWFLVSISETDVAMRMLMREHVGGCHPAQLGCVVSLSAIEENGGDPLCAGIVFLCKSHMGSGLVAHELTHAAFRLCERVDLQVRHWERPEGRTRVEGTTADSEEIFCDTLEKLTRQFWTNAYEHGYA